MSQHIIRHEKLQEVLQGHLDPVQRRLQRELGDVPIGENGLTVRLWHMNYLAHYSAALRCFAQHRFARNFRPIIDHGLWAAEATWTTETLRVLDRPAFGNGAKARTNLTISKYHERYKESTEVTEDQKRTEAALYAEITDYQDQHELTVLRNRLVFHLDLEECLANGSYTLSVTELTRLVVAWYSFAAGVVIGGEPRYVTEGAAAKGRLAAKALVRMMLDSLRFHIGRGRREFPANRYGDSSDQWCMDLAMAEEDKHGLALAQQVVAEMQAVGMAVSMGAVVERRDGRLSREPRFDCPDKLVEAELVRRFNEKMEANRHCWRLRP